MPRLTVIIPTVEAELTPANTTLRSLRAQTFQDFVVEIVHDTHRRGASWARNQGFKKCQTELVLFSDDDISWYPDAFVSMIACLDQNPRASYVYCGYQFDKSHRISMQAFDAKLLTMCNYISTMSIIRTAHMPEGGFDEALKRFQDWDLWLVMLTQGHVGIWCERCLYTTAKRQGITYGGQMSANAAERIIKEKHKWTRLELQSIR